MLRTWGFYLRHQMKNDFYVYIHRNAKTDKVFYVGKGCKKRAWLKNSRSVAWKSVALTDGYTIEIIHTNLTEKEALTLEKNLIDEEISNGTCLVNIQKDGSWYNKTSIREKMKIWSQSDEGKAHLLRISRLGGKARGKTNVETGQISKIHSLGGKRTAELGYLKKIAKLGAASRWGYEKEPGLWVNKKTNKVILDLRTNGHSEFTE
jgi:hypothetical protein